MYILHKFDVKKEHFAQMCEGIKFNGRDGDFAEFYMKIKVVVRKKHFAQVCTKKSKCESNTHKYFTSKIPDVYIAQNTHTYLMKKTQCVYICTKCTHIFNEQNTICL